MIKEAESCIFAQEEPRFTPLRVTSGLVKASLVNADGDEHTLWVYGRGAIIGLPGERCGMTALVRTGLEAADLPPDVLAAITARRLHDTEQLFANIKLPVHARLSYVVIKLYNELGVLHVTQEQLGSMIGSTGATVNRALRVWERAGFVKLDRSLVIVHDVTKIGAASLRRTACTYNYELACQS